MLIRIKRNKGVGVWSESVPDNGIWVNQKVNLTRAPEDLSNRRKQERGKIREECPVGLTRRFYTTSQG